VRPANVVAGGLAGSAVGLYLLTLVQVDHGLLPLVLGSVVISLGMGPVFGLTTEMVVGSAPEEKAGAASGVSETAAELGGALGIAAIGSVGVAIYRGGIADGLPDGIPDDAAQAAGDTLGGAVSAAAGLPGPAGAELMDVAREAFVAGLQVTSAAAAVLAGVTAIVAAVALRQVSAAGHAEEEPTGEPVREEAVPVC
jgi:DHA2 family multidrug resistance protein-like MFS transporter